LKHGDLFVANKCSNKVSTQDIQNFVPEKDGYIHINELKACMDLTFLRKTSRDKANAWMARSVMHGRCARAASTAATGDRPNSNESAVFLSVAPIQFKA
jgi:hypothetical protein